MHADHLDTGDIATIKPHSQYVAGIWFDSTRVQTVRWTKRLDGAAQAGKISILHKLEVDDVGDLHVGSDRHLYLDDAPNATVYYDSSRDVLIVGHEDGTTFEIPADAPVDVDAGSVTAQSVDTDELSTETKPWADVTAYGAVGDGVADDTSAFVSALENGSDIYVPEGIYTVTQPLTIQEGQSLRGDGRTKSTIQFDGVDGIVTSGRTDEWTVSGIHITDSGSGAETVGFDIQDYSSGWILENCHISEFGRHGIHHSGLNYTVSHTTLLANGERTADKSISVYCDGSTETATTGTYEHIYCQNGGEYAFFFQNARQVEVNNCIAEYHDVAFRAVDCSSLFVDLFWTEQIADPDGNGEIQSHDSNVVWKSERSPTPTRTWEGVAFDRRYPVDMGRLDAAFRDVNSREITADEGVVVTTPDGTAQYRISVDNNGDLVTDPL